MDVSDIFIYVEDIFYIRNGLLQFRDKRLGLNILDLEKTRWDMVDCAFFEIYSEYISPTTFFVHNIIKMYSELVKYKKIYGFDSVKSVI